MDQFFFRLIFILFATVFQYSFLNTALYEMIPHAILFIAIAWTLVSGFLVALPWIIVLGLIFDIVSLNPAIGITSFLVLPFSYTASFVSKRFLLEHQGFGVVMMLFFSMLSSVAYAILSFIVQNNSMDIVQIFDIFSHSFSYRLAFYETVLFLVVYFIVLKIEGMFKTNTLHISIRH